LIVRKGEEYITLSVKDIVFIYRSDTIVIVTDKQERKYLCDKNLTQLEEELDAGLFFRVNRQYLVNINFIKSFKAVDKVKLEVFLKIPHSDHPIIVSQKTAPQFRKWIAEE
jgi:DNA-binding LytR/AlgR family response regulator